MTHTPVLVQEFLKFAAPKSGDHLLDATLGLGGHALSFLASAPNTKVTGLDADPLAIKQAQQNLADYQDRVRCVNAHFSRLKALFGGGGDFSNVLFDLGIGSHQLSDNARGFSFQSEAPLVMRYGQSAASVPADFKALNDLERFIGHPPDADEIIQKMRQDDLADLIRHYGEERYAGRVARLIKERQPATAKELASAVMAAVPGRYAHGRIHPATRTFQALRLAVNRELESLASVLPQAVDLLAPDGQLAVISFHSLEDRIVKQFMKSNPRLTVLTKKPVQASEAERQANPRSRSAKLRVAIKTNKPKQTHDLQYKTTSRSSSSSI